MRPHPLFVVGRHRSGTTWLANLLCEHPSIAGVQHERHYGIHESAFFSHVDGRYGPLDLRSNFIECVEVMAASDYFRLAGATREEMYRLWPTSYSGLFRSVMDRFAEKKDASIWVEKTPLHTLHLDRIGGCYPDARFIGIRRPTEDVVASILLLTLEEDPSRVGGGLRRWSFIAKAAAGSSLYERILRRHARRENRVLLLDYEQLRRRGETTLRQVCRFLDLPFDSRMLETPYERNSSYREPKAPDRGRGLAPGERTLVRLLVRVLRLVPLVFLRWIRRARRGGTRQPLPRWFFRLLPIESADPPAPVDADARVPAGHPDSH